MNLFSDCVSIQHFDADDSFLNYVYNGKTVCVEKDISMLAAPPSVRPRNSVNGRTGPTITATPIDNLQRLNLFCNCRFVVGAQKPFQFDRQIRQAFTQSQSHKSIAPIRPFTAALRFTLAQHGAGKWNQT